MKKVIPFIIALPALFLVFVFKVIPGVFSVIVSTKDYNIFKGISGSESVGLSIYSELFGKDGFTGVIMNTVRLSAFSIILTCIFAVILIICISRLPWRWLKLVSMGILSIPALIPALSFVWVFSGMLSPSTGIIGKLLSSAGGPPRFLMAEPALYPFLFAIMDSLRNVYIPVIIGVLIYEYSERIDFRRVAFVILGYIAARATILMTPDIENIFSSSSPLTSKTSQVMDLFIFRSGLQQMQLSVASAAWVLKTIIQLAINIVVFFVLCFLAPSITSAVGQLKKRTNGGPGSIIGIIGYILFAAGSVAMIVLTFIPSSGGLADGLKLLLGDRNFMMAFTNSIIYSILICIIYGFAAFTLACPMTVSTKVYPFILLILLSLSNNFVGEYMFFRGLGLINTVFPMVISSGFSIAGAFALYFCVSAKLEQGSSDLGQYVKASLLPLLSIVIIAFIANGGGYLYQIIYFSKQSMDGLGLFGYKLLTSVAGADSQLPVDGIKSAFIFIFSIVPAVLGAILIALNKFLPLSAFTAQIRKG